MEKYKINKINIICGAVFFLFGAIALILAVVNLTDWNEFKKTAVTVNAEITEINKRRVHSGKNRRTEYDVFVKYEYDGNTYSGELDIYAAGMREGGNVTLYIDPENPSDYRTEILLYVGIPAIFFLIFGGIGGGLLIYEIRMSIYINRLIREDKYVFAEYSGEQASGTRVNNVRYLCSVFIYDDGFGHRTEFRSQPHSPGEQLYTPGETAKVYVDMDKRPKKHYISRER